MPEPTFELLVGDAREHLRTLQDDSIHCCVTSPPYYLLRDYETEWQTWGGDPAHEHEWGPPIPGSKRGGSGTPTDKNGHGEGYGRATAKGQFCECGAWRGELGQEPHPDLFVEHLVEVFEEVRRVLRSDGCAYLNVDDTYMANRAYQVPSTKAGDVRNSAGMRVPDGLKPKDLALVPQRLALALQSAGWWVRCDIVWNPPNAMPESVQDRPSRSHEYVLMLTKSPRYFWDQEAVREPSRDLTGGGPCPDGGPKVNEVHELGAPKLGRSNLNPSGRNLRSVWAITTESFPGEHYAVMPVALASRCILAATSEQGCCSKCGVPIRRVVERESLDRNELPPDHPEWRPGRYDDGKAGSEQSPGAGQRFSATRTLGWEPGCDCGAESEPCRVLDPFGGAMTTALASMRLGRSSVSIELSPEFAEIGRCRMEAWWKDRSPSRTDVPDGQLSFVEAVPAEA